MRNRTSLFDLAAKLPDPSPKAVAVAEATVNRLDSGRTLAGPTRWLAVQTLARLLETNGRLIEGQAVHVVGQASRLAVRG